MVYRLCFSFYHFYNRNNKIQNLKGVLANSVELCCFYAVSKFSLWGQRRHSSFEENMLTIYAVDLVEFISFSFQRKAIWSSYHLSCNVFWNNKSKLSLLWLDPMCWILAFLDSPILVIAGDTGCYFTKSVTFCGKVPSYGPGVLKTL